MLKSRLARIAPPLLALPRPAKRLIVVILDACLCALAVWLAYYLRLGEFVSFTGPSSWAQGAIKAAIASVSIALPIFIVNGLYRAIFRYSGGPALLAVSRAVGVYGLIYASLVTIVGITGIPRTVGLIQPLLLLMFVGSSRALAHLWLGAEYTSILKNIARPRVLIYGAGKTGRQLADAMANSYEMRVVGFLDDDEHLHGQVLNGLPIHSPEDLASLAPELKISSVLLAIPSASRQRRNEILARIRQCRVAVRTLPRVSDLAQGKAHVSDLQELDIDDLLGRDPVPPNHSLLAKNISNKVVLVTGAGGSIGSELCRQIFALAPAKLLLIEQSEFALYSVHMELENKQSHHKTDLVPLLASVQDYDKMNEIMATWRPDTVYHAAAYKHVPLVEHNPAAGIKNNVFGTLHTAQAALANHVANFVLISTDKAVRPTNIMGASKRMAEKVLQALAAQSVEEGSGHTVFSMVRFGNVLGSSGSVVPLFRKQIRDGGPITLTHPEITRYFMTIPEAAQLVIQAGAMAKGGEVFVLDMGESVKIMDLALRMIELSGLSLKTDSNPNGDIEIEISGLRPGEKLYEELLIGDNPQATSHPKIMKAQDKFIPWDDLSQHLAALDSSIQNNDVEKIRDLIWKLMPCYQPTGGIVDLFFLEQGRHTPHTGNSAA